MPIVEISAKEFAQRLAQVAVDRPNEYRFAFLLGAGCSVSSGIPTGSQLLNESWIPQLHRFKSPQEPDSKVWAATTYGYELGHQPPEIYGRVMHDLFPTAAERQSAIEAICAPAIPGFGYATLAQLMSVYEEKFNVVLTTNFDDLVADALFMFVGEHPLMVSDERMAEYIRASRSRPLIVKLHGHHQYRPMNLEEEIAQIDDQFAESIRTLLYDRGVIVVGYAGHDPGVKELLRDLPKSALRWGIYWVGSSPPNLENQPWMSEREVVWVNHRDFDELMLHIRDQFGLQMPNPDRIQQVFANIEKTGKELTSAVRARNVSGTADVELKEAAERVEKYVNDWAVYELRAGRLKKGDPKAAMEMYEEGLRAIPDSAPLHGNYANFLREQGEHDKAQKHYELAINIEPPIPGILHDFALFLWRSRHDLDRAGSLFDKAHEMGVNNDALRLGNYATFIWEVRKDPVAAKALFQQSVDLSPFHSNPYRQYALFMAAEEADFDLAHQLLDMALQRHPNEPYTLIDYAALALRAWDSEASRQLTTRAYAAGEDVPGILGAFARFMYLQRWDIEQARQSYDQLIAAEPMTLELRREYYLASLDYAELIWAEDGDFERARAIFNQGRVMASKEPSLVEMVRVGEILWDSRSDEGRQRAIEFARTDSPDQTVDVLCMRAHLLWQLDGKPKEALRLLERAEKIESPNPGVKANMSGLNLELGNIEAAMRLAHEVVSQGGHLFPNASLEAFFYMFAQGPESRMDYALPWIKGLLLQGFRSLDWECSQILEAMKLAKNPWIVFITQISEVLSGKGDIRDLDRFPKWQATQPLPPLAGDS